MPTASVKPSKPQNKITKHQTKSASTNINKKNLKSSTKSVSTTSTKQHQAGHSGSVQSTSVITSMNSKPPSNHSHSCGQISSEDQHLKLTIDSLVTLWLEQTVFDQKMLIDQLGHSVSVWNSQINDNSTTSSLTTMDIATNIQLKPHITMYEKSQMFLPNSKLCQGSSPTMNQTFLTPSWHTTPRQTTPWMSPSFNQLNSSRTQNQSASSIFKPDQCIIKYQ